MFHFLKLVALKWMPYVTWASYIGLVWMGIVVLYFLACYLSALEQLIHYKMKETK